MNTERGECWSRWLRFEMDALSVRPSATEVRKNTGKNKTLLSSSKDGEPTTCAQTG
jgi:hypothetical protein